MTIPGTNEPGIFVAGMCMGVLLLMTLGALFAAFRALVGGDDDARV